MLGPSQSWESDGCSPSQLLKHFTFAVKSVLVHQIFIAANPMREESATASNCECMMSNLETGQVDFAKWFQLGV